MVPKKILIIRFSSIGDITLTLPVIDVLKSSFPTTDLYYLTKASFSELIDEHPAIDCVISLPKGKSNLLTLFRLIKEIQRLNFDYIIDLHANLRSNLISFFSGTKVIRYPKHRWDRLKLVWFKLKPAEQFHTVDNYLQIFHSLGISVTRQKPIMPISSESKQYIADFLGQANISTEKLVAIAPGARHSTKQWLPKRFAEVAETLACNEDVTILIIGSEKERYLSSKMVSRSNIIDMTGCIPLRHLSALLARCDLLLCNDSGTMHISVAVGTPVVAIFGSTVSALGFYPLGENDVVVESSLACRPCHLHGRKECPEGHFLCMNSIQVDDVIQHLLNWL